MFALLLGGCRLRKDDVPQDAGLFEQWHEISYAVDSDGKYVQVPSAGWSVSNFANILAWEEYYDTVEEARKRVLFRKSSPIEYYMIVNQMDVKLLSKYVGMLALRVRWHLRPSVFNKLDPTIKQRYADVFNISLGKLHEIPATPLKKPDFLSTDADMDSSRA